MMTTANATFGRVNDNSETDKTALDLNCISHITSTENGYEVDECSIDFKQRLICK